MSIRYKGRPVQISEWYADGVDSYVISAYWEDTLEQLTDEEMDELSGDQLIYGFA